MKLVVVGGVAGGASAAARVRRLDENADITIFEKGNHVSYSNCSLPYYLGGVVASSDDLVMMTPQSFKAKHNIDVKTNHEVISIDRESKKVSVRNGLTGEIFEESYDKLVLSPGGAPIMPKSIKGIDRENVFSVRNVDDVIAIHAYLDRPEVKNVAVIGGGFIGIEVAENLIAIGKTVTMVEGADQVMAPFDYDMAQYLHKEIDDNGVALCLNSTLTAIEDGHIVAVKDGREFTVPADAVIVSIGVAPETALAKAAGLDIGQTRGIKVNEFFQTNDPDIYAVGDAIETFSLQTGLPGRAPLAAPAQKEARIAANHIYGIAKPYRGYLGSSCLKAFSLNAAVTGMTEKTAKAAGVNYDYVYVCPSDKVGIMPDSNYMSFKLLFEVPTGKLLGAQAIGKGDATKRIDAIAALIGMGGDLDDLISFDHCYAPVFSTAKDVVHMAGLVADNVLRGALRQVHVNEVRALAESGAYILDVREKEEFDRSHIIGAHNIPTTVLRQHLEEIPRDVPVYLHCRTSQRSYYAYCCLKGSGFDNVINISGSYLGLCLYEYFNDKSTGRKPIVTGYNFE